MTTPELYRAPASNQARGVVVIPSDGDVGPRGRLRGPSVNGAREGSVVANRVVICGDSCLGRDILEPLEHEGFMVVPCGSGQALIEEVVQHHPGVVIYGLGRDVNQDLGVLKLLRHADSSLPLVLLACEGSLAVQKLVQGLRPTYYAVCPVDPAELQDAVRAALNRPTR